MARFSVIFSILLLWIGQSWGFQTNQHVSPVLIHHTRAPRLPPAPWLFEDLPWHTSEFFQHISGELYLPPEPWNGNELHPQPGNLPQQPWKPIDPPYPVEPQPQQTPYPWTIVDPSNPLTPISPTWVLAGNPGLNGKPQWVLGFVTPGPKTRTRFNF